METEHIESTAEQLPEETAQEVVVGEKPIPEETLTSVDVTHRLAEDFLMLAEEFPQFISPAQLPDGVLDMAAEQNISLLDAYLRYRLQEEKRVAAAAEKREQAARQSAGSLSRGAIQTPPEEDAFLRSFRAAL